MKDKDKNKESEKKSFYFKDYTELDIIANNKDTKIVKVLSNRITFLSFIFFSLILIFSIKIIFLSLSPDKNFFSDSLFLSLSFIENYFPGTIGIPRKTLTTCSPAHFCIFFEPIRL